MRAYLVSLLLVTAVTAVLSSLPHEEKIKKTVSFALSLAVLATIVLPLPSLLEGRDAQLSSLLSALDGTTPSGSDWLKAETLDAVAEGMRAHLVSEYGLPSDEVGLAIEGDVVDGTVIVRHIRLTLGGRAAAADIPSIVRALEGDTGAECEVIYLED